MNEDQSPRIPGIYFNGFVIAVTNADIGLTLRLDNAPLVELKGSYSTIKTLAAKLGEAIAHLEKTVDHVMMTTEELDAKMKSLLKIDAK